MLEGERERRQLAGRVRLGGEERSPVQRADAHAGVLERRRGAAERLEPLAHERLLVPRLLEVLGVQARELRIAGDVFAL